MQYEHGQPAFDLTGRVAIVTGGAGLLAAEHAKALSAFGAIVVLQISSSSAAKRW